MIYIGLDPSLTATGCVILGQGGEITSHYLASPTTESRNIDRPMDILHQVSKFLSKATVSTHDCLVSIEGPSYGSKTTALFELGELAGILQQYFLTNHINYIFPSPTEVKQLITGKGNADKDAMKNSLSKIYSECSKLSEHEIDAIGIALYGKQFIEYLETKKTAFTAVSNYVTRIAVMSDYIKRPKALAGKKLNAKFNLDASLLLKVKSVVKQEHTS